jgi:hypothetical protein
MNEQPTTPAQDINHRSLIILIVLAPVALIALLIVHLPLPLLFLISLQRRHRRNLPFNPPQTLLPSAPHVLVKTSPPSPQHPPRGLNLPYRQLFRALQQTIRQLNTQTFREGRIRVAVTPERTKLQSQRNVILLRALLKRLL